MRIAKKAGAQIVAGSRTSRARQKKIAQSYKKARDSLKAAKKSLNELKAKVKLGSKQFAGHMIRAEDAFTRGDELGGDSPWFPSEEWEEGLFDSLERQIDAQIETVDSLLNPK